jgi:hypothetical protein
MDAKTFMNWIFLSKTKELLICTIRVSFKVSAKILRTGKRNRNRKY